jgi:hypothetical protein
MGAESRIERRLRLRVEAVGGWAMKLPTLYVTGLPDRLCMFPGARMVFAETKIAGGQPRPIQWLVHDKLRKLGFDVMVIDSDEDIDTLLERYSP